LHRAGLSLVLALALAVAAPAAARAEPGVSVELPDRTVFLSAAELAADADVPTTAYTVRDAAGASRVENRAGISVRRIVSLAGANPDVVSGLSVAAGSTSAYLLGADLNDPPPFAEGPPVVWVEDDTTGFLRPVRDDGDANDTDLIVSGGGAPLTLSVQSGAVLEVTAGSDKSKIGPGKRVSFWASALGADSDEQLTYKWRFGDGTTAVGQEVRHRYRRAGRYRAFVTVSGDAESGGSSSPITIKVGKPPPQSDGPGTSSGAFEGTGGTGAAGPGDGSSQSEGDGEEKGKGKERQQRRTSPQPNAKSDAGALEGQLLAQAGATPTAAPTAATRSAPETESSGPPATLWGVLPALALLLAGAVREWRGR
jgi:hypothetical protein